MKKLYSTIFTTIAAASLWAQSIETSGFDPQEIRPDASSVYTVILKDISGNIAPESIPMPAGLKIVGQSRSQSFSMGTGGTSSSLSLQYTVVPDKEGVFTVPEWSVEYKGKTFKVAQAVLKVDKNAPQNQSSQSGMTMMSDPFGMFGNSRGAAAAQRQAQRQTQSLEDSLRTKSKLEIKLPREKIYVGETVPCSLVFSYDKSLLASGFILSQLIPEIKNADAFDCPAFTADPVIDKTTDPEKVYVSFHTLITPLKVGDYDLQFSAKGVFVREINMDELMGMSLMDRMLSMGGGRQLPFEIEMPAKKINVLDLPADGKPSDFGGAIGKFTIQEVRVDPDSLSVGEPCIIHANIVGMGNFGRISPPELETDGNWKTYKPKASFSDESDGQSYIGIKSYEYTAVPTKPDLKFAPKLNFTYFDPETEKYVSVQSPEIAVSVAPTGRSQRAKERELEEAKTEPALGKIIDADAGSRSVSIMKSPIFWSAQVLIVLALGTFIVVRKKSLRLESDPAYAKSIRCRKQTEAFLKKSAAAAAKGDAKSFFGLSRSALQCAIAADSEPEASSITLREAKHILKERDFSDLNPDELDDFFDGADAISFGGLDPSKVNLAQSDAKLSKLCRLILKK